MFTLVPDRERNQDPLFPVVPVQFPVPVPAPFSRSVNEPQYAEGMEDLLEWG